MKKENIIIGIIVLTVIVILGVLFINFNKNETTESTIKNSKDMIKMVNSIYQNINNELPSLETMAIDINNLDDCTKSGYEWLDNKSEAKLYFNLVSLDNTRINDAEVNIIVTSTSPYKKILKGKFSLSRQLNINDDVTLNCNNYDEKVEVIVSNLLDSKKTYTLYFDSDKLRVDMTSNLKEESKDSNDFINKIAFDLDSNKNIKIVFYKTDLGKTYDKNDFKINLNN